MGGERRGCMWKKKDGFRVKEVIDKKRKRMKGRGEEWKEEERGKRRRNGWRRGWRWKNEEMEKEGDGVKG